jgi:anaerobic ribonucleoside-triphosphate reductase activating protein
LTDGTILKEQKKRIGSSMDYNISVLKIIHDTIVDGIGLRTAIYSAGCNHKCVGCHNRESWNINNGKIMKIKDIYEEIIYNPLSDITFTGGDPMLQAKSFCELAKMIKTNTSKTIWCYTGYCFEDIIITQDKKLDLLKQIDVLVDGKFEVKLRTLNLPFCGSSNQRVIDVQKSLHQDKIIIIN